MTIQDSKNKKSVSNLKRRDELNPFDMMRRQMNDIFDVFGEGFGLQDMVRSGERFPRVDFQELEDRYLMVAELPGMKLEDIQLSLDKGVLSISGEKSRESSSDEGVMHHTERSYGAFHRQVSLPGEIDEEKIEASYEAGLLKVEIPKKDQKESPGRKIIIKNG